MQSAIAFGVFIAIVGYFITRSEDKKKEEEQKKINDRINDSRSMLKIPSLSELRHSMSRTIRTKSLILYVT